MPKASKPKPVAEKKDSGPDYEAQIAALKMKLDLIEKKSAKQAAALKRMGINS